MQSLTLPKLNELILRAARAKVVLIGDATHGTHEMYLWRNEIARRLIQDHGFQFVCMEADWPDCYAVNRWVKNRPLDKEYKNASELLFDQFKRWPSWMSVNWEMASFLDWMRRYNIESHSNVGFYGFDVYSLASSMQTVMDYVREHDPKAAEDVQQALDCFASYAENPQDYSRAVALNYSCRDEVVKMLRTVLERVKAYDGDPEQALNVEQNAHVASNAERYYRNLVTLEEETWNVRDTHMVDCVDRLMKFYGPNAKCIIMAHNTHCGDARFTSMKLRGRLNVGQLIRERYGESNTFIIGTGTYHGSVIASKAWGQKMEKMPVPDATPNSWEDILHKEFGECDAVIPDTRKYDAWKGNRAIGVVFRVDQHKHNFVSTNLARRYDGFLYLHRTHALHPVHWGAQQHESHGPPDLFPWGF
jgi:erythromycin esterase-like protein